MSFCRERRGNFHTTSRPLLDVKSIPLPFPAELDRLSVVLISTRNPLNIGAAARAMSNFGFRNLRVVDPYDAAFREARSAVGGAAVLAGARECASVADAVADCTLVVGTSAFRGRELFHPLRRLEYGGRLIRKHLATGRVALLFGSEKFGLSNDDLSYCDWLMRIPTGEENVSMNLGQAVAVCLYELVRGNFKPAVAQQSRKAKLASSQEVERIIEVLLAALQHSGYVNPAASTGDKVRRLVRRLNLPQRDAQVWVGIFRQILWKTRQKS